MKLHCLARYATAAFLALIVGTAAWAGGDKRFPLSADYVEECGSCHVPYPPRYLPAANWQALMSGLNKHFGSDAGLDAAEDEKIGAFLAANARRPKYFDDALASGGLTLRITDTAWFKHKHRDGHDGLSASVWQSPAVKSPANCGACHRQAAAGDYSERGIRIPVTP